MRLRWRRLLLLVFAAVALGGGVIALSRRIPDRPRSASPPGTEAIGIAGTIRATTSTGRRGAYYLPRAYESRAFPLLVFLHGTGGTGSAAIGRLRGRAEQEGFIAVAPDAPSLAGVWVVEGGPRGPAEDHRHVMRCADEVLALPGVRVDRAHVLITGFSVGGSAAASIATHEGLFTAFAILHGHVDPAGLGALRPRGWLSTGEGDRLRPVASIRNAADFLTGRAVSSPRQ